MIGQLHAQALELRLEVREPTQLPRSRVEFCLAFAACVRVVDFEIEVVDDRLAFPAQPGGYEAVFTFGAPVRGRVKLAVALLGLNIFKAKVQVARVALIEHVADIARDPAIGPAQQTQL